VEGKDKMLPALLMTLVLAVLPSELPAQERYTVSYGGFAGYHAPLWAAKDLGLFAKHGLNADPVMISGSPRGMQALLSGSSHFALADATGPVSALYQGADVVLVASAMNKFPFSMYAQKEITRHADLKGKRIGIASFGGATEWGLNLALREWNIPRDSVTVTAHGPGANRLLALSTRGVDAALLAPPETAQAESEGMRFLGHLSELKANFPMAVVVVRRAFLEKNRDPVKRFIQAYSEAIHEFKTNKDKMIAVYNQRLKQRNPEVIEQTYSYFAPIFFLPPRVPLDGARYTLELITQRSPAVKSPPAVEHFVDNSIVDELEREGFFKKLAARR
jgi:ABC-type nitrate/sulfonate/bicarbonate transport system substrate-binding protein